MKNNKKIKNGAIIFVVLLLVIGFVWFFYFKNKQSVSLSELYTACRVECGKKSSCEGKTFSIFGYFDRNNISAEKFLIQDNPGNLAKSNLEVKISGDKNTKENIAKKINDLAKDPEKSITITGTVTGFDMPVNGNCQRGFELDLYSENNLAQ